MSSEWIIAGSTVIYAGVTMAICFIMRSQAKKMESQLRQMRSAGSQTERLITQATRQVNQLTISAAAAKASADGLKMSERAWMVSCKPDMSEALIVPGMHCVKYNCVLQNMGRTPARIVGVGIELKTIDSLAQMPKEPTWDPNRVKGYNKIIVAPNDSLPLFGDVLPTLMLSDENVESVKRGRLFLYGYGFVKYLTVFAASGDDAPNEHILETRFCHCSDPLFTHWRCIPCIEAPDKYHGAT